MRPASPKLRIRSEFENRSATKDSAGGRMGEHAGRPDDDERPLRKASALLCPAMMRSRVAKVSCIDRRS